MVLLEAVCSPCIPAPCAERSSVCHSGKVKKLLHFA